MQRNRDEDDLLPRAFAVAGEMGPESGPPTNGLDYLRRVRWEANRCPTVVVSDIDPSKFSDKQTRFVSLPPSFAPTPPGLKPSHTWEQKFIASFAELHQNAEDYYRTHKQHYSNNPSLPSLPPLNDARRWKFFCLGSSKESSSPTNHPTVSIIMQLDQVAVSRLLGYHVKWIEKSETLSDIQKEWLFALLGRLDKPLDPDMGSSLRSLLRRFTHERAKLSSPSDPNLPSLNILITILAIFYGQRAPSEDI